ncbi:hypothetical protein M378DRAFT_132350 [Amanita muscaria Koide BX008]|uniref:Uncharacterized protein n=1 Tax=Amanita muscaria (strain Koide BX008) TaxID=946122 RepID=A0A0C2SWU5_AMAMK|nr:hypothetical protein M378DRAFT_132350 [Amanita muscaria Koide BX008]
MNADIPIRVDTPPPIIDFTNILQPGFDKYNTLTGTPLPEQLDNAISPDSTLDLIDQRHADAQEYDSQKIRGSAEKTIVNLHRFSIALPLEEGDDSPPKLAKQFFAAVVFLVDAAKNDANKYVTLIELFQGLDKLLTRVGVYLNDEMESEVQEAMAQLLAETLVFIGFATEKLRNGLLTHAYIKSLMGEEKFWKELNYTEKHIIRDGKVSSTALLFSCRKALETVMRVVESDDDVAELRKEFFKLLRDQQDYIRDVGGNLKSGRLYMMARQASWDDRFNGHIFAWLEAPDPSKSLHLLLPNRAPKTGLWWLEKEEFNVWKTRPNSFMFLNGQYGCGKSYLCSTVIENLKVEFNDASTGVAYFFFDIYDRNKVTYKSLLTGLVAQLSVDFESTCAPLLQQFYQLHDYGRQLPFDEDIAALFKDMVMMFQSFYLVIDDMEECGQFGDVMVLLESMKAWNMSGLHVFLTGNQSPSSYPCLEPLLTDQYQIKVEDTNLDISLYIDHRVANEEELAKWSTRGREVMQEWLANEKGVFQWSHLQLQSVYRGRSSISGLLYFLREMPSDLDGAYKYMFTTSDYMLEEECLRIYPWLAYCLRPVTIEEYCAGLEFSVEKDPPVIDHDYRMRDPIYVFKYFPNLTVRGPDHLYRASHGSLKKALEKGDVIEVGMKKLWSTKMDAVTSNCFIAKGCLAFLLQLDNENLLRKAMIDKYPLAVYAAHFWFHHVWADASIQEDPVVVKLLQSLFKPNSPEFKNWVGLYDVDKGPQQLPLPRSSNFVPNALYYASLVGLKGMVGWLIDEIGEEVNVSTGFYGNALQVASVNGHTGVVEILLEKGADVNATGGFYHTALQAASFAGKKEIVQLLLDKGAEVGVEGGYYGQAWKAAEKRKHSEIAQLLKEPGAVVL